MTLKKLLYPPVEMCADIDRMAAEIQRDFCGGDPDSFALIGLYKQGVPLAERICDVIEHRTGRRPRLGKLDISMYRDDVGLRSGLPLIRETVIPFDVTGDAITDYGRPELIRLAVLVDRGNPEYPIRADYVGRQILLPDEHKVSVLFDEDGDEAGIYEVNWKQA